jgi:hypothetical protein
MARSEQKKPPPERRSRDLGEVDGAEVAKQPSTGGWGHPFPVRFYFFRFAVAKSQLIRLFKNVSMYFGRALRKSM